MGPLIKTIFPNIKSIILVTILCCFLGLAYFYHQTLNHLRTDGKLYNNILQGQDLIADILPPPLYIIEPYLLVLRYLEVPDQDKNHLKNQFKALEHRFHNQFKTWETTVKENETLYLKLYNCFKSAEYFFTIINSGLFPDLDQPHSKMDPNLLLSIDNAYKNHRAKIDELVAYQRSINKENINAGNQYIQKKISIINLVSLLILAIIILILIIKINEKKLAAETKLKDTENLFQTILNCISHELKTPLTAILGHLAVLKNKKNLALNDLKQELTCLELDINRLNMEINNILNISRLKSGYLRLNYEWVDLNELLQDLLYNLNDRIKARVLHLDLQETLPFVYIDSALMALALNNILQNALKHTPEHTSIHIQSHLENHRIKIQISDKGPGVPDTYLPRIFDMFSRVSTTSTGGIGLGLAIVKTVMNLHQGNVIAENHSSGGLALTLSLPCKKQPIIPEEARNERCENTVN